MQGISGRVATHVVRSGSVPAMESAGAQAAPSTPTSSSDSTRSTAANQPQSRWVNRSSPGVLGEERTQDVLLIGLCAAFSLIGWLMIVQGGEQIHTTRAIARWPTTIGTVASVDMQEVEGSEGARWRPQVTYYYSVNGRVIASTRLSHGPAPHVADERAARAFLTKYPPQRQVTVHYNPAEVTESVLEPGAPRSAQLKVAVGLTLAAAGPILLVIFGAPIYRRLKSPRSGPLTPTPRGDRRGPARAERSSAVRT